METFVNEFEVPEFTKLKLNGDMRNAICKSPTPTSMRIYPNGDEPENEGHVSVAFDKIEFTIFPWRSCLSFHGLTSSPMSSFQCTLSIVDINGESRFSQSFGMNFEMSIKPNLKNMPIKLERFIDRSVLLHSNEELLPNDTLTLRCSFVCTLLEYLQNKKVEIEKRQSLYSEAKAESWFIQTEELDNGCYLFDFRNTKSDLCSRLKKKSDYFEKLFDWPGREMEVRHIPIQWFEYSAFFNMLCYVRYENLDHIWSNEEYCHLYEISAKYLVNELQKKCSVYLEQNLTPDCAIHALRIADLNSDPELRSVAFRCILSNWKNKERLRFAEFYELGMDLRNQLTSAAQVLKLEHDPSDTLCFLAARQVRLNWEMERNSPTWSIFERKLPDLAKVISSVCSGGYILDSWDCNLRLAESYRDDPLCYNCYL